jgi:hypothetical protein
VLPAGSEALLLINADRPVAPPVTEAGAEMSGVTGAATIVLVKVPVLVAFTVVVTTQVSTTEPEAAAVKVIEVPLVLEVMLLPVLMLQA